MDALKKILKTIRFEKFIVRKSAQHEIEPGDIRLERVYINNDEKSELKNLTNSTAKELADLAIFG